METIDLLRILPYAALSAVVVMNVLGNVFMKLGSSVDERHALIFGIFGWHTLLGISCFASGVLFYGFALKVLPLYLAQAVVALQFIGVILAAAIFFGEAINAPQWFGMIFIVVGLSLVTRQLG
jgi:drug/metabolite transporter (DMT)-like permease